MKTSEAGKKFIKLKEGLRLNTYKCSSNVSTIGYGHTGSDVHPNMTITKEEAERLFSMDLYVHENNLNKLVKVPLTQGQFDALVSLEFNIGYGSFRSSSILRLVNEKRYDEACKRFLFENPNAKTPEEKYKGCWVFNNQKKVVAGLVQRRKEEQEMFAS